MSDYSHLEPDVVLTAPLRTEVGECQPSAAVESSAQVLLWVLVEHQSKRDESMTVRLLAYLAELYDRQRREWLDQHGSAAGLALEPVLPVVLYTGSGPWPHPKPLVEHVHGGKSFARFLPRFDVLFLGLRDIPGRDLEERAGFLGTALELLKDKGAPRAQFEERFRRAIVQLESMPPEDVSRWRELALYVCTLVYYSRDHAELRSLEQVMVSSVRSEEHREEVTEMFKSAAQVQLEKGIQKGEVGARRATLLRQLRVKFGELPDGVVARIEATSEVSTLDAWLDGVLTAEGLESLRL